MVAFIGLMGAHVVQPLHRIPPAIQALQQATGAMQRVEELLDEPVQVVDSEDATHGEPFAEAIRFDNVSFSYSGEQLHLNQVSLVIPKGHTVAFVGPSGCGKSTILGLAMRFYDPTMGSVRLDGTDVRQLTQESLRSQFGAVLQDTVLFNTTVRENIRIGKPGASDQEVENAAIAAEIHETISELPDGYDTVVGGPIGRLSVDQRQRVAIAAALLRDPAVLVLDEATSTLDPAIEASINGTVQRLSTDRTVVLVTHSLSSIVHADRIFVMERGQLVEEGSHEELLAAAGVYNRLWEQQSGFIIGDGAQYVGVEATRLQAISMLKNMDGVLLAVLANHFVTERFPEDSTIFEAGSPADKLYIIVHGQAEVLNVGPTGEEQRLAVLRDGDYFGEMALLQDVPHSATIRTSAPTLLLTLDRDRFFTLLEGIPDLRAAFDNVVESRRQANLAALQS